MRGMLKLLLMVLLAAGFVGGLILIQKRQDTRGKAYFSGADLMMVSGVASINVGRTTTVTVVATTGANKLTGFDLTIKYDQTKLRAVSVRQVTYELVRTDINQTGGRVRVVGITNESNPASFLSGGVSLVRIDFEGIAGGASLVMVESGVVTNALTGYNPSGDDQGLQITSIAEVNLAVTGGASPTPIPTRIPTPTLTSIPALDCDGQYFGKWQCDSRADKSKPGRCQLNSGLGPINLNNLSDPVNTWKWSYCGGVVPTAVLTVTPTRPPVATSMPTLAAERDCDGQYYGKPQCEYKPVVVALKKLHPGGSCQLNEGLGPIDSTRPEAGINTWKWSFCW